MLETTDNSPGARPSRYDRRVIGNLGRRAIDAIVVLFALLGFAFVPLGKRTALEHTRAIFASSAAADAARELAQATGRLKQRMIDTLNGTSGHDTAKERAPERPQHGSEKRHSHAPRPDSKPSLAKRAAADAGADASQTWPPPA